MSKMANKKVKKFTKKGNAKIVIKTANEEFDTQIGKKRLSKKEKESANIVANIIFTEDDVEQAKLIDNHIPNLIKNSKETAVDVVDRLCDNNASITLSEQSLENLLFATNGEDGMQKKVVSKIIADKQYLAMSDYIETMEMKPWMVDELLSEKVGKEAKDFFTEKLSKNLSLSDEIKSKLGLNRNNAEDKISDLPKISESEIIENENKISINHDIASNIVKVNGDEEHSKGDNESKKRQYKQIDYDKFKNLIKDREELSSHEISKLPEIKGLIRQGIFAGYANQFLEEIKNDKNLSKDDTEKYMTNLVNCCADNKEMTDLRDVVKKRFKLGFFEKIVNFFVKSRKAKLGKFINKFIDDKSNEIRKRAAKANQYNNTQNIKANPTPNLTKNLGKGNSVSR